jgi:hypothetical protein
MLDHQIIIDIIKAAAPTVVREAVKAALDALKKRKGPAQPQNGRDDKESAAGQAE